MKREERKRREEREAELGAELDGVYIFLQAGREVRARQETRPGRWAWCGGALRIDGG